MGVHRNFCKGGAIPKKIMHQYATNCASFQNYFCDVYSILGIETPSPPSSKQPSVSAAATP